jgi:hypothetical protein
MTQDGGPESASPVESAATRGGTVRWVSTRPGDGSLPRTEAVKDEQVRRWDVVTPSATRIGRADAPENDLRENVRRLHDEQHPAMAGHAGRMHRLDKARIAHALCSTLDLTGWERDRVLGIVTELDLTRFGSQRAIPKVALVVIQHVVDRERQRQLGLDDHERIAELDEGELEALYGRFTSIKDENAYRELLDANGLDRTSVNRLNRVLREQLDERGLRGAALGRSPFRDPNLPAIRDRSADVDEAPGTESDGAPSDDVRHS